MDQDTADETQYNLFVAEGEIAEDDLLELEDKYHARFVSERREIRGYANTFSRKGRFSIADPGHPIPLDELLALEGKRLPPDIQSQIKEYEFYQIELACSFDPDPGCRFHDARFDITLQTLPVDPDDTTPLVQKQAIAYDLAPLRCEEKRTDRETWSFKPEIIFPSLPSLTIFSYERVRESISNMCYVEAINLRETKPGWKFLRTQAHEISGSQKLIMLVRKPKGTQVEATFSLTAHVQLLLGQRALEDLLPLGVVFRRRGSSSTITGYPSAPLC